MAHGNEDNYEVGKKLNTYISTDFSEGVVRLGSGINSDRLGNVIVFDSFEDGEVKSLLTGQGTGSDSGIKSRYAKTGGFSGWLRAGSDGNRAGILDVKTTYIPNTKLGFELSFVTGSELDYLYFKIFIWTGSIRYDCSLKYDHVNNILYYYNADGLYTEFINPLYLTEYKNWWNTIKLVIDTQTGKFVRLNLWYTTYDMSSILMYKVVDLSTPYIWFNPWFFGLEGDNNDVWVDDIIITQNEP